MQANSSKYISYFHKDKIRICLRGFVWTQFASRDSLSMKQGGNIYLLGVNIASWQHYTKWLIHYVLKFWVIVYLLQYKISMITISETMKTMQHHGLVDIGHHFESFTIATTTWFTVMEYQCHKWPRIYFNDRKHFPFLSSLLTFLRILIKNNSLVKIY